MPYFQVEVISNEIEIVRAKYEKVKAELGTNILIQTFEGTNRHIFTFAYARDVVLEEIFAGIFDYAKEQFILSVLSELSHEGIVERITILQPVK